MSQVTKFAKILLNKTSNKRPLYYAIQHKVIYDTHMHIIVQFVKWTAPFVICHCFAVHRHTQYYH